VARWRRWRGGGGGELAEVASWRSWRAGGAGELAEVAELARWRHGSATGAVANSTVASSTSQKRGVPGAAWDDPEVLSAIQRRWRARRRVAWLLASPTTSVADVDEPSSEANVSSESRKPFRGSERCLRVTVAVGMARTAAMMLAISLATLRNRSLGSALFRAWCAVECTGPFQLVTAQSQAVTTSPDRQLSAAALRLDVDESARERRGSSPRCADCSAPADPRVR
jgi:hypothetical protein